MKTETSRDPSARRNRWFWLLLAVIALGFLLRLANLLDTSHSPFFSRPVIDGQVYDRWALAIKAGSAPHEPFYQDPLYPYFLALVYMVFGHSYWAVYALQLVMGVILLYLLFDMTKRLFEGPERGAGKGERDASLRAGVVAALLGALYKPFIFYEAQIEKTALAVFLSAVFLWALVRGLSSRKLVWPLAAGLALGLAALTRANMLVFALGLPIILGKGKGRGKGSFFSTFSYAFALLSVLGVVVVVAPVAIRNSLLGHELILTTTQGGQNLYIGNSPYNNTGQYQAPSWVRPNPDYEQADFREYARKMAGHELSYSAVSRFFSHLAMQWATTHPRDFLGLLGKKVMLYFNNFEVPDNQDLYFFSRYSWVLRLPLLMFGVVFALGFAGMVLLRQRSLARQAMFVFFLVYAGSVIVFFVFSRYRLPATPALFPFAGAILIRLWDGVRDRLLHSAHRLPPPRGKFPISNFQFPISNISYFLSLLLVAACGAITLWPIQHKGKDEAAQCLVNLGAEYYQEGDTAKAVATFNEALQVQPEYGEALRNLGILQLSRGRTDEAFNLLSQAEQSDPGNAVTHQMLGKVWEQRRMLSPADIEYRRAVVLAPGRVEYRFSLATVLQNLDSVPAALAQYDTMIALAPDNPLVRHNHAVALFRAGRLVESAAELDTTRRLGGQVNPQFEQALRQAITGGGN